MKPRTFVLYKKWRIGKMAREAGSNELKKIGKILLITFGIILLIELFMYYFNLHGGNIMRIVLGKALV